MTNQLGPIEITCDAPPYVIVRASRRVGVQSPEDVRWCRIRHRRPGLPATGWRAWLRRPFWAWFLGLGQRAEPCSCRAGLPPMSRHTFTFASGKRSAFVMGQCPGCHAVYWEEVQPND